MIKKKRVRSRAYWRDYYDRKGRAARGHKKREKKTDAQPDAQVVVNGEGEKNTS